MDAARAWTLFRRWWWLLFVGTVMAVAAYGVSARVRDRNPQPPVYAATARLFVSLRTASPSTPGATEATVIDRPFDMDRLLYTYTTLLSGHAVASRIVDDLHLQNTPADVQSRISVAQPKNTQLIDVTARAAAAADADTLAWGALAAFMEIRREQQLPGDVAIYETTPAALEHDSTSEALTVLLVAVAGLVAASSIVLAFEYLSDAVRDAAEAEAASALPVLATIPPLGRSQSPIATNTAVLDRFRFLRTNIGLRTREERAQAILFAAAHSAAATSETAANYAAALARSGRRVVLIDGDLRAGDLGTRFGSEAPHGLADALALDLPVYGLVDATDIDGLSLVAAGAHTPDSSELLESPRLATILRDLRERFDAIVIAAPALIETPDAATLASHCDAAVLVARCERTTRTDLAHAAVALHRLPVRTLGCVLSGDASARPPFALPFRRTAHEAAASEARA
jgi:capsular exopolysaccharide synthesis family protein